VVIGGITFIVPVLAGLAVFFDPLRRKTESGGFVRVTSLSSLPEDGAPRKFPVLADQTDAWNRTMAAPIGAVYLRRLPGNQIEALNVICPHAGCFVDYAAARKGFLCPCHNSLFTLEGRIADAKSPSPRGLDELQVEIRNESEIWVRFQNFRAGIKEQIPV